MNLSRGFKRITLVLSTIAALSAWFCFSEWRFRNAEQKQKALEEDAEQYRFFWHCWDANDFCAGANSKKIIVEDFLSGPDKVIMVPVRNGGYSRVLFLVPDAVFPGINDLRVHYDSWGDDVPGVLRMSDSALEKAAQAAKAKCLAFEPYFSQNFGRSTGEMVMCSIFEGVPIAGGTFTAVWLLFLIFKWLCSGFHSEGANTAKTPTETHAAAVVPEVADEYDSRPLRQEVVKSRVN